MKKRDNTVGQNAAVRQVKLKAFIKDLHFLKLRGKINSRRIKI